MSAAGLFPVNHLCADKSSGGATGSDFHQLKGFAFANKCRLLVDFMCAHVAKAELSHGSTAICQKDSSFQQL